MRILQLIADGRPGGGTTHVLSLMRDLMGLEHEVHFVSQQDSYILRQAREMGAHAQGVNFFFSRLDARVPLRLSRIVRHVRPDLIHAHGSRAGFFLSCSGARDLAPVVYTVHGYHFPHKPSWVRPLAWLAERKATRMASELVLVSDHDRMICERFGLSRERGKGIVIYNGIEDIASNRASRVILRCVGFLGRVESQKDPLLFVETLRLLAKHGYYGKMIGGGAMEGQVIDLIRRYELEEHIRVTGALPRAEALREISEVGCILFPSKWEGMPIALLEAMKLRIPVVASHVGGIPEIVEDKVSGLLFRDRDPRHIADAVMKLTTDLDFRERIIETAADRVAARFDARKVTDKYLALYRRLLGPRQP
jgi:glycosyltransferase involved in cell wall biosynthesis